MAKTYKTTRTKNSIQDDEYQPSLVSEPAPAIGLNFNNPLVYIATLLGIAPLQTEMQYVQASRNGIKKAALAKLISKMGITQDKMCQLLHISTRTYQRLKDADTLDIYSSEQAIEMAQVLAKAQSIFTTDVAVKQWLHAPLIALGGVEPINLLDTGFGAKLLLDTLGRIEYGVYS